MDATSTMLKIAYLKGLEQAATKYASSIGSDPELIKEALLGDIAKGALKWGIGKPVAAIGKMLGRQTAAMGSSVGRATARGAQSAAPRIGKSLYTPAVRAAPAKDAVSTGIRKWMGLAPKGEVTHGAKGLIPEIGRFGKNLVGGGLGEGGKNMSRAYKALTMGGRNVPSQMLQYGTITGAMGGLTGGEPGDGWSWSGAGKGFLGGAAGGLGWAAGGRLAKAGLGKMLAGKSFAEGGRMAGIASRAKNVSGIGAKGPSFWGQKAWEKAPGKSFGQIWKGKPTGGGSVLSGLGSKAKDIGLKTGLKVPTVAGALGASIAGEEGVSRALGSERSAVSPESMAARGAYAMTPQGRMARGYY
jgi:hypothetical protein